jgi:L-threonylcarbamoyladenylate synthase
MSRRPAVWRWGDHLQPIREILATGGMLAIPTESSYGLAADPKSREGVESIFRFKGRSSDKPLPVVVGNLDQLAGLGIDLRDPRLQRLASLWPAPLSVIVATGYRLPAAGGGGSLAVRIPQHERLVDLLIALQSPLTATSANQSGADPICDPGEMIQSLVGRRALVVDDGPLPGGLPSTIVTLGPEGLVVVREGRYPVAELRQRLLELGWSWGFSAGLAEKSVDRPGGSRR